MNALVTMKKLHCHLGNKVTSCELETMCTPANRLHSDWNPINLDQRPGASPNLEGWAFEMERAPTLNPELEYYFEYVRLFFFFFRKVYQEYTVFFHQKRKLSRSGDSQRSHSANTPIQYSFQFLSDPRQFHRKKWAKLDNKMSKWGHVPQVAFLCYFPSI